MHLLIGTAGRPRLFSRTLDSLLQSKLPESLRSVIIVENGEPCGAERLCQQAADRLPIEYRWSPQASKSAALNRGLQGIADDALVVMSDDDVRFEPGTLIAYEQAAAENQRGKFFGGPYGADFSQTPPPPWVLARLPNSARGWTPDPERFDPQRELFVGFNWAAFARDLRAAGGFDERYGPGSPLNFTGQETRTQHALHRIGLRSHLVEGAFVWHYVPPERCSAEWAVERANRHGAERGFAARRRGPLTKAYYHLLNGSRLALGAMVASWTKPSDGPVALGMAYEQARSAGFFRGFYQEDPSENLKRAA